MRRRRSGRGSDRPLRVTVVGQLPPPYHGQAVMIAALLETDLPGLELRPVRMAFSRTVNDNGRAGVRKVLQLVPLVARILVERVRGSEVLYFPPSGDDFVPVARDLAVLVPTRWAYPATVLHFHAAGLSTMYERSTRWRRKALDLGYAHPEVAIQLTALSPPDGVTVRADRVELVPNGIPDPLADGIVPTRAAAPVRILFVAFLRPPKGVEVLLAAAGLLAERGVEFAVDVVGEPDSDDYDHHLRSEAKRLGIEDRVTFHGVLIDGAKDAVYRGAHVFCFPSYYSNENLPVVLLEAMAYGLPIVTSHWRGLPDAVLDGETGMLVPTHDVAAVADALQRLAEEPDLRLTMGKGGRQRFLTTYTLEVFQRRVGEILLSAGGR